MRINFKKIPQIGVDFETSLDKIRFYGKLEKKSKNLVQCSAQLEGVLSCQCDRCGEHFSLHVDENIDLLANDGLFKSTKELLEVIEFFEESVDLEAILLSEVETLKSDYHYCTTCSDETN